jgi:hypothetical protein
MHNSSLRSELVETLERLRVDRDFDPTSDSVKTASQAREAEAQGDLDFSDLFSDIDAFVKGAECDQKAQAEDGSEVSTAAGNQQSVIKGESPSEVAEEKKAPQDGQQKMAKSHLAQALETDMLEAYADAKIAESLEEANEKLASLRQSAYQSIKQASDQSAPKGMSTAAKAALGAGLALSTGAHLYGAKKIHDKLKKKKSEDKTASKWSELAKGVTPPEHREPSGQVANAVGTAARATGRGALTAFGGGIAGSLAGYAVGQPRLGANIGFYGGGAYGVAKSLENTAKKNNRERAEYARKRSTKTASADAESKKGLSTVAKAGLGAGLALSTGAHLYGYKKLNDLRKARKAAKQEKTASIFDENLYLPKEAGFGTAAASGANAALNNVKGYASSAGKAVSGAAKAVGALGKLKKTQMKVQYNLGKHDSGTPSVAGGVANVVKNNKGLIGGTAVGAAALGYGAKKLYDRHKAKKQVKTASIFDDVLAL